MLNIFHSGEARRPFAGLSLIQITSSTRLPITFSLMPFRAVTSIFSNTFFSSPPVLLCIKLPSYNQDRSFPLFAFSVSPVDQIVQTDA